MYYHLSNDSQNKNNINNKENEYIKALIKIERDKNFYFLLNETHAWPDNANLFLLELKDII